MYNDQQIINITNDQIKIMNELLSLRNQNNSIKENEFENAKVNSEIILEGTGQM